MVTRIYPLELQLDTSSESDTVCSFSNLHLSMSDRQGYRYHKIREVFQNFIGGILTLCLNIMSDSKHFFCKIFLSLNEFYDDLVYKSRKRIGNNDFPYHFKKIFVGYIKIVYNIDVLRQTAFLVVNPVKVNSFAYLLN